MKPTARLAIAFAVLTIGAALAALYFDGQWPAEMGGASWGVASELTEALQAVDSRGAVDLEKLKTHRRALDAYVANLASTSTDHFAPDEETAFWLNAFHAVTLQALLDGSSAWRSWPIGGHRLTRASIVKHHLRETGDPRVPLATWDGTREGPGLESEPFDAVGLDRQLTEAVRHFVRRRDVVQLKGKTVEISPRLLEHEAELLAALPEGNRQLLQFVWAFLPDTCDGERPGCETRTALDSACGRKLDGCTVRPLK